LRIKENLFNFQRAGRGQGVELMKHRYLVNIAFLILTLATTSAFGEQSTGSTGNYEMDLGQVYGAIKAVKAMEEICGNAYPEYIKKNEVAYQEWRAKYKPFLQEMERHFTAYAWREAGGDTQRHMEVLRKLDDGFKGYKKGLEAEMRSEGEEAFRNKCQIYPIYLMTDRLNLEHFYAEQVSTIRKGPKE